MYSINYEGKILDYRYKQLADFIYAFYVGDIYVGQLFRMGKQCWSCVSSKPHRLSPVDGFRSRLYAAQFLLVLNKYIDRR